MKEEYEYFYNGVLPIRATKDRESGTIIGTETPDQEKKALKLDMKWGSKIIFDTNGDFWRISENEFNSLCSEVYER